MRREVEVVVAGAGPAGATVALLLARAGVETLLLEKRAFPRDKLCGGFLAARTLGLLENLHGAAWPAGLIHHGEDRFQIWQGGKLLTDRQLGDRMAFVQRVEFDEFLARQAVAAGAHLLEQAELAEVRPESDGKGLELVLADGRQWRTNWLVGADGVFSRARRWVDPDWKPGVSALELQIPCLEDLPPRLDFGLFPWGYGWRFPKRGVQTVGVCGATGRTGSLKTALHEYLERLDLSPATALSGWPLPDQPARLCRGRVLLVGDAAGLCEPISGEGIYFALRSGERAARALLAARLTSSQQAEEILRRVYRDGTRRLRRQLLASRLFRPLFHRPAVQERLLRVFSKLPDLNQVEWPDILRHATLELLFPHKS